MWRPEIRVVWIIPITPVFRKLSQKDKEFSAILGYR